MAGTASALLGFVQLGSGALIGSLVGALHDGTPVPMAVGIALCSLAVLASHHFIVGRTAGRGRV
jgi:DHA1 family bicyclomycin/chloramphenicol resistance-like MFS transporter